MKQVTLNDNILTKLKAAVGDAVDPANYAIFAATALNTLPVRKNHPVYKGGVHPRSFLEQMSAQLGQESLPLQVMHDSQVLPIGRIFEGGVVDDELQVLFWVDKSTAEGEQYAAKINSGTIDQVSVSVLPKSAISNKSGFDFLGSDATFEHFFSGTDPDGNVMGKDGAHVIFQGLDSWFEMSLVGRGGATGARILPNNEIKLVASGQVVPLGTLTLSSDDLESTTVDLKALVDKVTELTAANTTLTAANAQLTADLTAKAAKVTELEGTVTERSAKVTELEAAVAGAPSKADLDGAVAALTDVAKVVFAKTGDVNPTLPTGTTELVDAVKGKVALLGIPTAGHTLQADAGHGAVKAAPAHAAFKSAR